MTRGQRRFHAMLWPALVLAMVALFAVVAADRERTISAVHGARTR